MLDTLLPRINLTPEPGSDPKLYFGPKTVRDVWLEIGFGAGEHLADQAASNPDIGFIGVEPYIAGMAKLLVKIAAQDLANVRLYQSDAREVIETLPEAALGRVFLLFPDPWPKKRHHKRRIVSVRMMDALARVVRPGAELRFATDDPGYLVWALERFIAHGSFRWLAQGPPDWRTRPEDWPETRYEAKAKASGRPCAYLRFVRR